MKRLSPRFLLLAAVLCGTVSAVALGGDRGAVVTSAGPGAAALVVPEEAGLLVEVECPTPEAAKAVSGLDVRLALPGKLLVSLKPGEESVLSAAGLAYSLLDLTAAGSGYYCAPDNVLPPDGFTEIKVYPELRMHLLRGRADGEISHFVVENALFLPHHASPVGWFSDELPKEARDRRVGALARKAVLEVDPGNIEGVINDLTYDAAAETLLTRYSLRGETTDIAMPYLESLLRENLGARGTVLLQPFRLSSSEESPIIYNVVGRVEGSGEGAGYYILSGHYDSIASRTEYDGRGWNWRTDPAPGADDNASGVAAVLECARVLANVELEFDLVFILFSGEEQVVKGSTYFVNNLEETDGPLLGVMNMDMIAYNPGQDTVFVVTDERSMWLADFLVDSYKDLTSEVGDLTVIPAVKEQYLFSDETPFQIRGIPAITCSEKLDVSAHNPYYHTVDDHNVDAKLNISQATKATKLVAGAIAALAARQDPPDLEILSGDIVFSAPPLPVVGRAEVGDTVTVSIRVRNVGGPMTESRAVTVTLYDGDPDLGAPVLGEDVLDRAIPAMGGFLFEPHWVVTEEDRGSHRLTAVVSAEGEETNATNNRAQAVLAIVGEELAVLEHYVYPNPGNPNAGEAILHYFLTVPSAVTVDVFDAMGRRQGGVFRPQMGGSRIPGYNLGEIVLPLKGVVSDFSETPGGIYFYSITAENEEGRQQVSGRFIMVR
jgi:hypothetical protein